MKHFKPYNINQLFLLPLDIRDWLPEGHLALFISDVVDTLDLSEIMNSYRGDARGQPPYHPAMMVKLLIYAYCTGKPSSRKIEKATYEDVAYRVLTANQHPDHDTICDFRKRHLKALSGIFLQVLKLCHKTGLAKLGHVSLDGTKVLANASKHKAMSYKRMCKSEKQLEEEIEKLLKEAEDIDSEEDSTYGKGKLGDELPEELKRREDRLAKIREAKAALEEEARERAKQKAEVARAKLEERKRKEAETGKKARGRAPKVPDPEKAVPDDKAQRNFTDPDSRIMVDGATKGFVQAYNGQAAVCEGQVIVAADVTQEPNDKKQLVPMAKKVKENLGEFPEKLSADSGYYSESNVTDDELKSIDFYIPPDRLKHDQPLPDHENTNENQEVKSSIKDIMRAKLKTPEGKTIYSRRKVIVEPVFGQIKEERGFRRFSFRGIEKVKLEWDFVCMVHNLIKLFRAGFCPKMA